MASSGCDDISSKCSRVKALILTGDYHAREKDFKNAIRSYYQAMRACLCFPVETLIEKYDDCHNVRELHSRLFISFAECLSKVHLRTHIEQCGTDDIEPFSTSTNWLPQDPRIASFSDFGGEPGASSSFRLGASTNIIGDSLAPQDGEADINHVLIPKFKEISTKELKDTDNQHFGATAHSLDPVTSPFLSFGVESGVIYSSLETPSTNNEDTTDVLPQDDVAALVSEVKSHKTSTDELKENDNQEKCGICLKKIEVINRNCCEGIRIHIDCWENVMSCLQTLCEGCCKTLLDQQAQKKHTKDEWFLYMVKRSGSCPICLGGTISKKMDCCEGHLHKSCLDELKKNKHNSCPYCGASIQVDQEQQRVDESSSDDSDYLTPPSSPIESQEAFRLP